MPENQYTSEQVAAMIGVKHAARVRQLAIASNGAIGRKQGRDWVFTDADVATLRQRQTRTGPRGKDGDTAPGPKPKEGREG